MLLAGMPQKKSVCQAKEKFTTILIGEIDTGCLGFSLSDDPIWM